MRISFGFADYGPPARLNRVQRTKIRAITMAPAGAPGTPVGLLRLRAAGAGAPFGAAGSGAVFFPATGFGLAVLPFTYLSLSATSLQSLVTMHRSLPPSPPADPRGGNRANSNFADREKPS